jgi:hypothetical protein
MLTEGRGRDRTGAAMVLLKSADLIRRTPYLRVPFGRH